MIRYGARPPRAAADAAFEEKLAELSWRLAEVRFALALRQLAGKANFNPNQPRVPRGNPDGGQWTRDPRFVAQARTRLAGGLPTNDPPEVPKERPATPQERHAVVKNVARWLGRWGGSLGRIAELAYWLYEYDAWIEASLDPPKSLIELQEAAAEPKAGYQLHHIVEQTPAAQDGYPRSMIDSADNVVRIPTLKHWEITAWYQTRSDQFGGLSPREYLRGKSWEERRRVGLEALVRHGVLKP